jgi:hypothetical protein
MCDTYDTDPGSHPHIEFLKLLELLQLHSSLGKGGDVP